MSRRCDCECEWLSVSRCQLCDSLETCPGCSLFCKIETQTEPSDTEGKKQLTIHFMVFKHVLNQTDAHAVSII